MSRPREGARAARYRLQERDVIVALISFEGAWLGALAVPELVAHPCREVVFALRRLVERGIVQKQVEEYRGEHRQVEYTRHYRLGTHLTPNPFVPTVKPRPPRAPVRRIVRE